ncbi:TVP38/TMEM64 family protein [Wukongibacter baidiensis]|uniref:TVP38/TMEM64 family protein n=1 Tax=Wukongibacter baidiensis TaxID=1723361 RepID=UPI003D7F8B16
MMMIIKNRKKLFSLIVILSIGFILYRYTNISTWLSFENLQLNKDLWKEYVNNNYIFAMVLYSLLYIVVVTFAIPGATVLTISGGFLFGTLPAMIYANISATIGATLCFLFSRYLIGSWIQNKYSDKIIKFNEEIEENGSNYLLTVHLMPIFPFFLINLISGITKVSLKTFIWTTTIGILPASFVYSLAGTNLGNIQSVKDILSLNILLALIALGLFALLPTILRKLNKHKNLKFT